MEWYSPRELRTRALLLCLLAAACASRLATPPTLFPASEVWRAKGEAGLEGSLASDAERVFVSRRDGSVEAFAWRDGSSLWRQQAGSGRLSAAAGAVVLRAEDGIVARLDPATGQAAWRSDSGVSGRDAAVIEGDLVFVAGAGLVALAVADGRLVWKAQDGGDVTAPTVAHGARLYVGEEDGTLRCRDRSTGVTRWTFKTASALRAPVLPDAANVLVGTTDGRFLSLSAEKGEVGWLWKLGADVVDVAVPFDRHSVLFATHENVLYALDRGNGHLRWRSSLPSRPIDGPRLTGSAALVACQESEVVAFDARSGRPIGSLSAPGPIRTAPLLLGDRLLLGLRDRSLVAFQLDLTPSKEVKLPRGPRPTPAPSGVPRREREANANPREKP